MRFSILFIFLIIIGGLTLWQNRPKDDPLEEAGKRIIAQMKREAALKDQREKMDIEDRKKETEKLKRKYPKLLDKCLDMGGYKRSSFHIHEFNDGARAAFCSGGPVDLKDFIGRVYYQADKNEAPQVIELGDGSDGPPGFDSNASAISFKYDGFHADQKVFYNDAYVSAYRTTYNCSLVTKECGTDKRVKCVFSKEDPKNKKDHNYLARIDTSDRELYELFFKALGGDKASRKLILNSTASEDNAYDTDRLDIVKAELKRFRRAGCF